MSRWNDPSSLLRLNFGLLNHDILEIQGLNITL